MVKMRLSLFELETIVKLKNRYFGDNIKIYLFGSRMDDMQKGGDIDLFVEYENDDKYSKKDQFLIALKNIIGEQKIDLVLPADKSRLIEIEARNGVELDLDKIKLQRYFNECDKHIQRIEEAYSDIKESLPLTVQKYKNLSKDEVQDIDQFLYRFSKLQDTLGEKIFKSILNIYEPSSKPIPFIDILSKLEKYDLIESAKEWLNLREVRNKISHQYDDEPYEMTQAINDTFNQKKILEAIYLKIKNMYDKL